MFNIRKFYKLIIVFFLTFNCCTQGGVEIKIKLKRKTINDSEDTEYPSEEIDEISDIENTTYKTITDEEKLEELRALIKVKDEDIKKPEIDDSKSLLEKAKQVRENNDQNNDFLQSIKDFEFQISENQDNINKLMEKTDNITKDLDDLVSLYEIVSEQMNPFVGLSKVTKKRIEALESFTKELEDIKNRLDDVEVKISTIKLNHNDSNNIDFNSNKFENNKIMKNEVKKELEQKQNKFDNTKKFNDDFIINTQVDSFIDNIIEELFIKNIK